MTHYHWSNPIRVPPTDAPTLDERTHTPDPAAVERLRALMAQQRADRERERQERQEAAAKTAAALRARRQAKTAPPPVEKPKPEPKVAPTPRKPAPPKPPRPPRVAKTRPAKKGRVYQRELSREQAEALHARRMAGEGPVEVAAAAGVSERTLTRTFRFYGLPHIPRPHHGPPRRVDDTRAPALYARYLAGERTADMAAELGVSRQTVLRTFCRAGCMEEVKRRPIQRCTLTDDQLAAADAAQRAGQSYCKLADELGVPRSTLRAHVKAYRARLEVSR